MTTIEATPFQVGLTFPNSQITIGGKTIDDTLGGFTKKGHTHEMRDITDLGTTLEPLINRNCVESDPLGNANINGTLNCKDVNIDNTSVAEKIKELDNSRCMDEYLTVTTDEYIRVGYPVYATSILVNKELNALIDVGAPYTQAVGTRYVPTVKATGADCEFLGICTEINVEVNGKNIVTFSGYQGFGAIEYKYVKYVTRGNIWLTVGDAFSYQPGQLITYDSRVVDYNETMTFQKYQTILGTVTGRIDGTTLAVYRA